MPLGGLRHPLIDAPTRCKRVRRRRFGFAAAGVACFKCAGIRGAVGGVLRNIHARSALPRGIRA